MAYFSFVQNRSGPKNQGKLLEVFLMRGDDIVTKDDLCLLFGEQPNLSMKMPCKLI